MAMATGSKLSSHVAAQLRLTTSLPRAHLLHAHLTLLHGPLLSTFLANCLIDMYGVRCSCPLDARSVFDHIPHPNLFSWNLMLRAYAHRGDLHQAQALFDLAPRPDVFTWNLLLKAYLKQSCLDDARRVFDAMPCRNVVSWTAMIAALSQAGHGGEALMMFYRMFAPREEDDDGGDVVPDSLTFLRALDACSGMSDAGLDVGQEIHASVVEQGFDRHVVMGTALVSMYGKCKNLSHSRAVFLRMRAKDIVCWTAFITACTQNEACGEAFHVFLEVQSLELKPDNFTFVCALDACGGLGFLREGRMIHGSIVEAESEGGFMVGTALVNFYGRCGSLADARLVFEQTSSGGRDVVSWNAMISLLVDAGHSRDALHLFWRMQSQAVIKPDHITLISALHACSNLTLLEEGLEIHISVLEYGHDRDITLLNSLISMYGKCRTLRDARSVFDCMTCRDAITYNVLISAYIGNDIVEEILDIFCQMQQVPIDPDTITFTYVIDACGMDTDHRKGHVIHGNIVENGFLSDPMVSSALVKMYGKSQSVDDAKHIFDRMPDVDIVSWTSMIGANVDNGCNEEALDLFHRMQVKGIQPDSTSFVCTLDACAGLAALDRGEEIHAAVMDVGCEGDLIVRNALINMYGKCGNLQKACRLFSGSSNPNVATWNALIAAYSHNGHGVQALEYFYKMQSEGVNPDEITFVSILTACSHAGWIEDGGEYFVSMERCFDVAYTQDHYVCMIDLFGRAGRLEEAQYMVKELSVEKADVAWLCLLGACRIHDDYERGSYAAKKLFDLSPTSATPYVMLANMSAAAKKWEDTL